VITSLTPNWLMQGNLKTYHFPDEKLNTTVECYLILQIKETERKGLGILYRHRDLIGDVKSATSLLLFLGHHNVKQISIKQLHEIIYYNTQDNIELESCSLHRKHVKIYLNIGTLFTRL
jgi:hypothetical protein